jgi:hypothetical protein
MPLTKDSGKDSRILRKGFRFYRASAPIAGTKPQTPYTQRHLAGGTSSQGIYRSGRVTPTPREDPRR